MDKINDGGPAYPGGLFEPQSAGSNDREPWNDGMSLRDWFAGQSLAGWLASYGPDMEHPASHGTADLIATNAYAMADAMLAARTKEAPTNG